MPSDIKFFGLSTCAHCKNAKAYLEECGEDFECVYVDKLEGETRKAIIEEVKKHNPSVSFPTMLINGIVIVGFSKEKIDKARKGEAK
ncbi:MAG: glutaredoxin family protein [Proteobacteria bacterium]|nr:glutaredoxin family protein [Pseudomonadota bacterium]MBU1611201.1 glutaredoxin family protein [Pseudomonadota bacterium]